MEITGGLKTGEEPLPKKKKKPKKKEEDRRERVRLGEGERSKGDQRFRFVSVIIYLRQCQKSLLLFILRMNPFTQNKL